MVPVCDPLCFLFCFKWYGDHRDLHVLTHSFPTRRSSVLLSRGDHVDAAFTVMNRAKDTRALKVSIEASGAARGKIVQSLTLKPFERRNVSLPLTVDEAGAVHFVAQAGDGADQDALTLDVGVPERPQI